MSIAVAQLVLVVGVVIVVVTVVFIDVDTVILGRFQMNAGAVVDLHVTLQVALVRRGVVAQGAGELFEARVDGVVAPQEGASAEDPPADGADVAVAVVGGRVVTQRRFVGEPRPAAFQDGGALFVHGGRVTLEIVAPVRPVRTQRARKQPLLQHTVVVQVDLQQLRLGHSSSSPPCYFKFKKKLYLISYN